MQRLCPWGMPTEPAQYALPEIQFGKHAACVQLHCMFDVDMLPQSV